MSDLYPVDPDRLPLVLVIGHARRSTDTLTASLGNTCRIVFRAAETAPIPAMFLSGDDKFVTLSATPGELQAEVTALLRRSLTRNHA
ncbi:MAG: hypothetical protein M0Q22_11905 [Sulfuritalea sp.]|jgi:hypothetical protein|nr:hypothetical protein [Sulfuritalea sp.]